MANEEKIIHKLRRDSNMQAGVTNEFGGEQAAKSEWRRRLQEAGYTRIRNGGWYKPGHPVIIDPF